MEMYIYGQLSEVQMVQPDPRAIDKRMQPLERFVILLYDHTSEEEGVNQARKHRCSARKAELLMVCLLYRLHSSNTPREMPTTLVTVGPK